MITNSAEGGVQGEVETKLIDSTIYYGNGKVITKDQLVEEAKAFGWNVSSTRVTRLARGRTNTSYIMIRDKNISHYSDIVEAENEYRLAQTDLKNYVEADILDALLLLLLFIIPGIIYITAKCIKKHSVRVNNEAAIAKMKEAVNKAKLIATRD